MAHGNKGGRPTRLTAALQAQIVARIQRFHAPPEAAAASLGVPRSTFYGWMARGLGRDPKRPAKPLYVQFADSIVKAAGEDELWHWGKLAEFVSGQPLFADGKAPPAWGGVVTVQRHRALLWSLEHRFVRPPPPYDEPAPADTSIAPPKITVIYAPDPDDPAAAPSSSGGRSAGWRD